MTTAAERLHPALQHHLVNSLAWRSLRPLQEAAIGPILDGEDVLLIAPTAGGKTEAAVLPVLSRMLDENWRGLSVLYLCPLRALLNNLEPRLAHLAALVGRSVGLWHGDITHPVRKRLVAEVPDILLTTPESLEAILISRTVDAHRLLRGVQAVIVDELHAFAGDDRGWHVLALLDRLSRLSSGDPQRLGLSATVGNADDLIGWLASSSDRGRRVVTFESKLADADLTIDFVGDLSNAARVVAQLHAGEKRLVFCDSRARVEQLGAELRRLEVETYLSHSSLGIDERRRAEAAFGQGTNCVIVATSTLELGLDVGDLDRVIQIDSPFSVSSFLQRLGRTGRRQGAGRNTLFLVTDKESFLRACAIASLSREGYVEPVLPPVLPYHVFAQQLLALVLQESRIGRAEWPDWIASSQGAAKMTDPDLESVIEHLVEDGWLFDEGGLLSIGPEAERIFGWRNFMELTGFVTSEPEVAVRYGQADIGRLPPVSFRREESGYGAILLAGRSWRVTSLDWRRKVATVVPDDRPGRSRWYGDARPLDGHLSRRMRTVLAGAELPVRLTRRASDLLESVSEEFWWVTDDSTAIVSDPQGGLRWWTFAGLRANAELAARLETVTAGGRPRSNLFVGLAEGLDASQAARQINSLKASPGGRAEGAEAIDSMKFAECLPRELAVRMAAARTSDEESIARCLAEPLRNAAEGGRAA